MTEVAVNCDTGGLAVSSNGQLILEAEIFTRILPRTGNASGNLWGYSEDLGQSAMQVRPDLGVGTSSDYGPSLKYDIHFEQAGTNYVYLRGYAMPSNGNNSVHIGLNGNVVLPSAGLTGFSQTNTWQEGDASSQPIMVTVPSVGQHTLNIWMREDEIVLDRIWLDLTQQAIDNDVSFGPNASLCMEN